MARSMPHVLPVLFLFALIAPCLANIGENEANVGERYGKSFGEIPTNTFGVITGFVAGGYVVGGKIVDGTSEMEKFFKRDQTDMAATQKKPLLQKKKNRDWKTKTTGKNQLGGWGGGGRWG